MEDPEDQAYRNGPSEQDVPGGGFESADFEKVLRAIGTDAPFAWVDVACIPQQGAGEDLQREADEEIGHQAGIFAKAHRAYIWLYGLSTQQLSDAVDGLHNGDWHYAKVLFEDPWFTSLWTLQEAFLRKGRGPAIEKRRACAFFGDHIGNHAYESYAPHRRTPSPRDADVL